MPPTTYHLRNESGIEVFTGTIVPAPGGGSQPGALYKADLIFNEPAGAHADLTATVDIPAGATVIDVWLYSLAAPWTAAGAILNIGDSGAADWYYSGLTIGVGSGTLDTPYDPEGSADNSLFAKLVDLGSFPFAAPIQGGNPGLGGKLYPAGDTITATVGTITAGGGGGQLLVRVLILDASTPVVAA